MILQHIALRNFRQHRDTEIAFREGVTGIVGANGAGKTTILEALAYALWGADAIGGVAGVRSQRATAVERMEVIVRFEHDGTNYVCTRGDQVATLSAAYEGDAFHDDVNVAAGHASMTAAIARILGLSRREWEATYACNQKSLAGMAGMAGAARKELVEGLLGITRIAEAHAAARAEQRTVAAELAAFSAGLGERAPLAAAVEKAQDDVYAYTMTVEEGEEVLGCLREEASAAQRAIAGLRYQKESAERAARDLDTAMGHAQRDLLEAQREVARRGEHAERASMARDRLIAAGDVSASLREALEAQIDVHAWQREHSAQQQMNLVLAERKAFDARAEAQNARDYVLRLKGMGSGQPCSHCGVPLGARYAGVLAAACDVAREAADREQAAVDAWSDCAASSGDAYAEEVTEADARVAAIRALDKSLEPERRLAAQLESAVAAEQQARFAVSSIEARIAEMQVAIAALPPFPEEEFAAGEEKAQEAMKRAGDAMADLMVAETELKAASERLDRAKEALALHDEKAVRATDLRERVRVGGHVVEALAAFRAAQQAPIRPELEALLSGLVYDLTDGRFSSAGIEEGTFRVTLYRDGLEVPRASGGEGDVVALALRLALAQMVAARSGQPLGLIILDEPFSDVDAGRAANVLSLLRRLEGLYRQVLVIAHREDVQAAFDQVVRCEYNPDTGTTSVSTSYGKEV